MPLDADVLAWRSCIGAPTARFGRHVQCHELLGTHRHWTGADIGGHISTTVGVHEPIFSLPQPDADQVGVELMNPGHARHRGPWLTARRHDLSLEFVAVFTTCTAFDCTHENVHLEVKWASSGALKWGARWEDWPLTKSIAAQQEQINSLQADLVDAQRQLDESHIPIDWTMADDLQARWNWFVEAMRGLARSNDAILHRGESTKIDRVVTRSAANEAVDLKATKVVFKRPAYLPAHAEATVQEVPCFTSESGFAAYFFPSFVLVERDGRFGLVRPELLQMDGIHSYRLISEDPIAGGEIIDHTWKYVNKDGRPDRRFSNNYQIPIFGLSRVSIFAPDIFSEHFYFAGNANALMRWEEVAFWHRASQRMDATKNVTPIKYPGHAWRYIILDSDGEEVPTILSRSEEPDGPPFSFQVKDELGLVLAISRSACNGVNLRAPVEFDIFIDDVLIPVDKSIGGNFNSETQIFIFPLRQLNDHLPLQKMLSGARQLMFRAYQNGRAVNAGWITLPLDFWSAVNMQLPPERLTQAKAGSISLDAGPEGGGEAPTHAMS